MFTSKGVAGPQQWITAALWAHSNGSRPLCEPTAMDHGPSMGPQQWITAPLWAHSNGSRPLYGPTAMDHGPSVGPQQWITATLWARSNGSRPLYGPTAIDHGPSMGPQTWITAPPWAHKHGSRPLDGSTNTKSKGRAWNGLLEECHGLGGGTAAKGRSIFQGATVSGAGPPASRASVLRARPPHWICTVHVRKAWPDKIIDTLCWPQKHGSLPILWPQCMDHRSPPSQKHGATTGSKFGAQALCSIPHCLY
jgi:hypothetical protein